MRRAFISYSRSSEGAVQYIRDDLLRSGMDEVWWDKHLIGAQSWWDTILHQIREADVVVCLVDVGILESLAVRREYQYAVDLGKPLLPILLSSDISITTLPVEISGRQYVDYRNENPDRSIDLLKALGNLPPTPALPQPLPHAPEMPRSERDYLVERVSSTEPLSEEVQNAVLNQLRRLARSGDTEQREFSSHWLMQLRDRRELYASVATDIDELTNNRRPRRGWMLTGVVVLVLVGAVAAFLIQNSDTDGGVDRVESNESATAGETANLLPVEPAAQETPLSGTTVPESPAPETLDQESLAVDGEGMVERLENTSPTTSTSAPDESTAALSELDDDAETMMQNAQFVAVPSPRWYRDFMVFEERPFKLCNYQGFSATALTAAAEQTILRLRSTDRSIPDQPFRGFDQQVPTTRIVELLPGCQVRFDHEITAGVARIRVRVKGDE